MDRVKILRDISKNIDIELSHFDKGFSDVLLAIQKGLLLINFTNPLSFEYELRNLLIASGYYKLINKFIDKSYDSNYKLISALFKAGGLSISYNSKDVALFKALKAVDLKFFNLLGAGLQNTLMSSLYKNVYSDFSKKDMTKALISTMEDSSLVKYAGTYTQTAINNYNQAVMDIKTRDVTGEVYIYVGVDDKITRDFCECVLDAKKYYDKPSATKLKNDKRRKYNCRHLVMAVSKEYAISEGYKKGGFKC